MNHFVGALFLHHSSCVGINIMLIFIYLFIYHKITFIPCWLTISLTLTLWWPSLTIKGLYDFSFTLFDHQESNLLKPTTTTHYTCYTPFSLIILHVTHNPPLKVIPIWSLHQLLWIPSIECIWRLRFFIHLPLLCSYTHPTQSFTYYYHLHTTKQSLILYSSYYHSLISVSATDLSVGVVKELQLQLRKDYVILRDRWLLTSITLHFQVLYVSLALPRFYIETNTIL